MKASLTTDGGRLGTTPPDCTVRVTVMMMCNEQDGLTCRVDVGGGVLLDEPPAVPDGLLLRAMYPKRPESELPHFSAGYPGQSSLQLPTDVVVPGAIFVHQHDWY